MIAADDQTSLRLRKQLQLLQPHAESGGAFCASGGGHELSLSFSNARQWINSKKGLKQGADQTEGARPQKAATTLQTLSFSARTRPRL